MLRSRTASKKVEGRKKVSSDVTFVAVSASCEILYFTAGGDERGEDGKKRVQFRRDRGPRCAVLDWPRDGVLFKRVETCVEDIASEHLWFESNGIVGLGTVFSVRRVAIANFVMQGVEHASVLRPRRLLVQRPPAQRSGGRFLHLPMNL